MSRTLPMLTALRVADEGRLVYIEEPEIHLHPRAQVKLADILAGAAGRGVRVVAETHSTLLLTAIQTLVAKGQLNPELVKFHWFQRDPKTGVTEVTSTDLDENGAFSDSDWPEDFDSVILSADGAYLDAVAERSHR
jgi:predicted ATPase